MQRDATARPATSIHRVAAANGNLERQQMNNEDTAMHARSTTIHHDATSGHRPPPPNGPSKNPGKPSGPDRGNNPPRKG